MPVRVGNGASGPVPARRLRRGHGHVPHGRGARSQAAARTTAWALVPHAVAARPCKVWSQPDDGIWEVRGPRRHFVHSKVMAWVAVDRWVKLCEAERPEEPLARWRRLRDEIHAEVCERAERRGRLVHPVLRLRRDGRVAPHARLVGFLPPDDARIVGTVDAIERELLVDGFVQRYRPARHDRDPVADAARDAGGRRRHDHGRRAAAGQGPFLLTTFWLVDNLVLIGRLDEAREIFERLLALRNDVGLLSEEYDPVAGRMLGNVPQAFSHIGLVNSVAHIERGLEGPAARRSQRRARPEAPGTVSSQP